MPKGTHDDLADATSQALAHFRALGLATLPDEDEMEDIESKKYRREPTPLYPAYGNFPYPMPIVTTGDWNR